MGSGQSTSANSGGTDVSGNKINSPTNVTENITSASFTPNSTNKAKKALLIGINYSNNSAVNHLNGCINDITAVKDYLEPLGFSCTLMSDNENGSRYPTRANILSQLDSFISSLQAGDALVIYYSGHGSTVKDLNGDEISGQDSCIVPIDFNGYSNTVIIDDVIRTKLVTATIGSKIFAVFDSCNSGSVCDLRCNIFDTSYKSNPGDINSDVVLRTNIAYNNNYSDTNADIISLSGSKDDQTSAEFYVNGAASGALTYALISYLKLNTPAKSFEDILQGVRSRLSSWGLSQNPSLMAGRDNIVSSYASLSTFLNL